MKVAIIQGLFGSVGFGVLLLEGYSSETAFIFLVLLGLPYILGRIAIGRSEVAAINKEHSKITGTAIFTFLAVFFGFLAGALGVMKIDKASMQAIVGSKPFLIAFYLCFMSALIADTSNKDPRTKKYIKRLTERSKQDDGH